MIETHIWGSLLALWWEGTAKEQLFWEKAFPLVLAPKQIIQLFCVCPRHSFGAADLLLKLRSRESKEVCVRTPEEECLGLQQPFVCLTQPSSLLVFTARVMGTSLPNTGTLGWRTWCGAGTPHFSGGLPSQNSSQFLTISHKCGTRPFLFYTFPTNLTETSSLYL